MAKGIVDLTNYRETRSSRVEPGRYTLYVEDADIVKTRKGDDMVQLWLKVLEGPEKGKTLIDRMVLTQAALFRIVNFMNAIGMATPRKRFSFDTEAFKGRKVLADVVDDEYRGEINSSIQGYLEAPKSEAKDDFEDIDDALDEEVSTDPTESVEPEKVERAAKKESSEGVSGGSDDTSDDVADLPELEEIEL